MKKIIIGLFFSIFVLSANANSEKLYTVNLPALCGTPDNIQKYLDYNGFKPFHLSLGRTGMNKDGEPVFMLTYMVNEDLTENVAVVDIPSSLERCVLFHTFDLVTEIPNKGWQKQISMIH